MTSASPPPRDTTLEGSATLKDVVKAVRKGWPLVIGLIILCGGASFVYSKSAKKIYDSVALIELNAEMARPLGGKQTEDLAPMGISSWMDSQEYFETQYRIIVSQRVLGPVVRDMRLASDPDFMGGKAGESEASIQAATEVLRSHVRVEPVKNSLLFQLHVEDSDPRRARRLCQEIATTFIDQNLQSSINSTSDAAVWLNTQLDHIKQELDLNENALYDFKERNELPSTSINEASNMLRLEMQSYMEALSHTRTKRQELAARHAELSKVPDDDPSQVAASELINNAFLSKLRSEYVDAQKERAQLVAQNKGDNHPLVRSADERVAQSKTALLAEIRNIKGAVERDLAIVQRQEGGENALYEQARRRAVELNMKEIEFHRLDRAREQNEKLYGMLLERMKDADLARMMRVNNIQVVESPVEPVSPVRPRVVLNLGVGLLVGLGLGVLIAFLRELLDSSIKTPEDVEASLQKTFLGLLPEIDQSQAAQSKGRRRRRPAPSDRPLGEHAELIVHERPGCGTAEAARALRTNLMFMNPDRPHRTLLVTSAAPAEGKTTVACSIAIAFAQGGQRVCIVDCDLRRPRLHRIFGRVGDAGVTNVLVGDASVDEVARLTDVPNLWCIPSGPLPPNPADMLHSERFKKLLAELADRFDRVIIDSAPLVAVTDSAIVSTLVDGTVFVIRAFKTVRALARQGLRALIDVDSEVVGVVLNAVNLRRHEYSYYHYYYYKREGYASTAPSRDDDVPSASASPPN